MTRFLIAAFSAIAIAALAACGKSEPRYSDEELNRAAEAMADDLAARRAQAQDRQPGTEKQPETAFNDEDIDALMARFGAQNRNVAPQLALMAEALDDPDAVEHLCAYDQASRTEIEVTAVGGRGAVRRAAEERARVESLRNAQDADMRAKSALDQVRPGLSDAIEQLRFADMVAHLQWQVAVGQLCGQISQSEE